MKNKLIKRMYIILFITVLAVSAGIFAIVFVMSGDTMMEDIRQRATGVKDYILDNLYAEDFLDIGEDSEAGILASLRVQEILSSIQGVGNLKRLYIAGINEHGELVTTLRVTAGADAMYIPTNELEEDLRRSITEGIAVFGGGIYRVDNSSVFSIFWPVMDENNVQKGVVGMEFDVDALDNAQRRAVLYSVALSVALIFLISIIAYLSLSRATEPYYKKLAYTDILTGYENRLAFEHSLRECDDLAEQGENVTLIICDVNNLKAINDVQGHKVGDAYIRNTADIISKNLSGMGQLYRIGGDEFASIITGKTETEINDLMNILRAEKSMVLRNLPFSCASGSASFSKDIDRTMRDVFKRADEAMYVEKKKQKEEQHGSLAANAK